MTKKDNLVNFRLCDHDFAELSKLLLELSIRAGYKVAISTLAETVLKLFREDPQFRTLFIKEVVKALPGRSLNGF